MSNQFPENEIKLEGVDASENVTEIQSYLEGFQKEIEGSDGPVQQITRKLCPRTIISLKKFDVFFFALEAEGEENEGEGEDGTYFMDQSGHYYYQSNGGDTQRVMTVMPNLNDSGAGSEEAEEFIINQDNDEENEPAEEVINGRGAVKGWFYLLS